MDVCDDEPRRHPDRVVCDDHVVEPKRRCPGRPKRLTDAEVVCLAVAQVLLGARSEHHWLRMCYGRLGHLFPYLPKQPGYHKRVKAAASLICKAMLYLATQCPSWADEPRLVDGTPVPCAASPLRSCEGGDAKAATDSNPRRASLSRSRSAILDRTPPQRPPGGARPGSTSQLRWGRGGSQCKGHRGRSGRTAVSSVPVRGTSVRTVDVVHAGPPRHDDCAAASPPSPTNSFFASASSALAAASTCGYCGLRSRSVSNSTAEVDKWLNHLWSAGITCQGAQTVLVWVSMS